MPAPQEDGPTRSRPPFEPLVASKVIYLRNLPTEVLKYQFEDLLKPYGDVVVSVKVKGKNQALVQMASLEGPTAPPVP